MSHDLSLSGALGGLRIANPDDSTVASPTSPTPPESAILSPRLPTSSHSNDTVTPATTSHLLPTLSHDTSGETGGVLGFNPDSYTLQNGGRSPASSHHSRSPTTPQVDTFPRSQRLNHRQSMPMAHQAQQQMQYPSYGSDPNQQFRHPSAQGISTRPVSGMYQLPNTSSSSTRSYGYRDDLGSSDGSVTGVARSGSRRVSPAMMAAGVPSRDSSRTYMQGNPQMNGGNGPLPPRRNSKRVRAPTNGSGNGYDAAMYGSSAPAPSNAEEWRERGAAVGTRQETDAQGNSQTRVVKKGVKDFNFGRTLGEGSYSTVLAATDRQTSKEYAIKVLDKRHIIKEKKVKYVNIERDTLNRLTEHPGIVRLYYTFQDERSLYFVLDLATGGELLGTLKKMGTFDMECSRFYGAQILDSIAYMHSRGVIHRDLKPENVLLDRDMHTKITDFGTAKILPDPKSSSSAAVIPGDPTDGAETDRAVSFVGTAEYVSPELLRDKNACKASDLWAFGCIVYQLLAGRPPFKAANEYLTFQKILSLEYSFPEGFPPVARDLVERLLVLEPSNRLPVEHIKNHAFFDGVQWGKALWRQKAPRLKPYVPPAAEPIKLNGANQQRSNNGGSYAPPVQAAQQAHANSQSRPQLRGITELPPPSQLDIDWSPVLTGQNERILKLGNLIVTAGPAQNPNSPGGSTGADPTTPSDKPKFRSFFSSGGVGKRKERLVLITSKGRVVVCAAGGNDKRIKTEISLLAGSWRSFVDVKGLTGWQYDNVSLIRVLDAVCGANAVVRGRSTSPLKTLEPPPWTPLARSSTRKNGWTPSKTRERLHNPRQLHNSNHIQVVPSATQTMTLAATQQHRLMLAAVAILIT